MPVASRMTEPDWAKTCMRLLDVELTAVNRLNSRKASLHSFVDYDVIYLRKQPRALCVTEGREWCRVRRHALLRQ
ncbi:hypothetical protein PybrP1_004912 [[Pythium] brassicae (nom. inval.)]|nr:hypothetical protein PybrP1_004912 [[Pythium] brassicae (nom. inval.)]